MREWFDHSDVRHLFFFLPFCILACQQVPRALFIRGECSRQEIRLEDEGFAADLTEYSAGSESHRAVVILPPTGGVTILDRDMAAKLCRAGFEVFVVKQWTGQEEMSVDLELHQRLHEKAMHALALVLKKIPEGFVGLMGTSVGGTFSAVAMNQFARFNAAFVIVGGAPLRDVIAGSDQKAMVDLRRARFEKFGFKNDDEYREALSDNFPLDTDKNPPLFKGKKLGMVLATKDTTVPTETQRNLRDYWQPQTVYELDNSHFWAIVNAWWKHKGDIVRFFVEAAK